MNDADKKNHNAIKMLTGKEDVTSRINSLRIGIWSDDKNTGFSGSLIADALGEFLGRFWKNIDVTGPFAKNFLASVNDSSNSGEFNSTIHEVWNPPYDYVLSIGSDLPNDIKNGLRIGGSGWEARIGPNASIDDNKNPVGPMATAAIASGEIFKTLFRDCLDPKFLPTDFRWSSWYGQANPPPTDLALHFDDTHFFGVGAVAHGLFWLLDHWPYKVTGRIHLIDHDNYDISNAQRYVGMKKDDIGNSKCSMVSLRLRTHHSDLEVVDHKMDMNSYFSEKRQDCRVKISVAGLDSIEGRRQLALKLPHRIVNMWTSQEHLGAFCSRIDKDWPCMFCIYSTQENGSHDEVSIIFQELGLSPIRIRELLYSGAVLDQQDASIISQKYQHDPQSMIGKPLRTVRGELCATGRIRPATATTDAEIPFVFSSALAGIGGFVELSREIWNINSAAGTWQTSVLAYPTEYTWNPRDKVANCYLCSDPLIPQIMEQKFNLK